jgi:hypothetical protein
MRVSIMKNEVDIEIVTYIVGFEVLMAVTIYNAVFLDVKPCGYCKNRRFGGTYRFYN